MKRLSLALILTLSLRGAITLAEPSADPSGEPNVVEDAGGGQPTLSPANPLPDETSPEQDEPIPTVPRGELVRLSRLPEAELLVDVSLASNDERSHFEVVSEKNGASLVVCGTSCRFRIWPGRYRVITNAS